MTELESFTSLADDAVSLGTKFTVEYVVEGGTSGTIAVSCKDARYTVSPDTITVTKKTGTARIAINGPAAGKVVVYGRLVSRRQFTQKVK